MISAALLTVALAQSPLLVSQFDDGQIMGRVCVDEDADGLCSPTEGGVQGARVLLETGLEAVTDDLGRFHFASVSGRAADTFGGGRIQPGRHRLKLDVASLVGEFTGAERGQTVEVSAGAAVIVSLALRASTREQPRVGGTPAFRKTGAAIDYELQITAPTDEEVRLSGTRTEGGRAWVTLETGRLRTVVPFSTASSGRLRMFLQPLEVIRRRGSLLVIPEPIVPVATVSVLPSGEFALEWAGDGFSASLDGASLPNTEALKVRARFQNESARLEVTAGDAKWTETLERPIASFSAVGLADVEVNYDVTRGGFRVFGRGAAAARASFFGFKLNGELDLRDTDFAALSARSILDPHRVDVFARQLDPQRAPTAWADDSATVAGNPSENRLRVELSRDDWLRVGVGSTRWSQSSGDVGRAHRALQGAFLEVESPTRQSAFGVSARGVIAPSQLDLSSGLTRRQRHERFESTGGSLFFLSATPIVSGSEQVRIEWRDSVTQIPLGELHLQRLRDYTVDPFSGRLLLTRPLSAFVAPSALLADPLTSGQVANLFVDYEFVDVTAGGLSFGGELRGRLGPVSLSGSGWRDGAYTLFRGSAEGVIGPIRLTAEVAHSAGAVEGLAFSAEGGLGTPSTPLTLDATEGWAATVRARSTGLFGKGSWDAAWRWRQSGFQDTSQLGFLQQVSVRGAQPLGPVIVTALVDVRDMPDPRDPFSGARVRGQLFGGGIGYESDVWGVRLEGREYRQELSSETREGFTLGLAGRVRVAPWLQLRAGYRQQLVRLGGMDLTFASLGVDVKPTETLELGLRGGWGPALGPQVWGNVGFSRGRETWYGFQSTDVDAPSGGERRLVTGVRQQLDSNTAVFAEDVSANDVDGLRLARAAGLTQTVTEGLTISARYEHGARALDGLAPDVTRNAGGVSISFEQPGIRLSARGEVRDEQGARVLRQFVASASGEWRPHRDVSLTARALWTHSTRAEALVGRTVDATLSAVWRFDSGAIVARYAWTQNWAPTVERRQHVVSLLPTVRLGNRFAVGAGGHLGFSEVGTVASASLRPSVRIWEGLEVAAEVAARSIVDSDSSWAALRGEVGYRFDHRFFVGVGFNALGFVGTGLDLGNPGRRDRVYLRAEIAY